MDAHAGEGARKAGGFRRAECSEKVHVGSGQRRSARGGGHGHGQGRDGTRRRPAVRRSADAGRPPFPGRVRHLLSAKARRKWSAASRWACSALSRTAEAPKNSCMTPS